ncbi:MAG TPA: MBL fold metallo-hydrolase RNA specificity domain-containing protein, partial [Deltaproteobacteria bacterium]|nr:MBL fold metallo-hydrolase RNA specificity domain-containing protein [Deltaproteobacteria bacterium]
PAFAVERTQEILYVLGEFCRAGTLPDIPVFLDSPLAIKATEIFRKNKPYYDEEAMALVDKGFDPFDLPNLRFTPTMKESMAINSLHGSAIIIAGNGMCTAGRIRHHLKHNLWRPGASIVIVGFQANGTTGRMLIEGRKWVKILRETVTVRAKVFSIGGFSAHADQRDLLEWAANFKTARPQVFLIHGEPTSSMVLGRLIEEQLGLNVQIPGYLERLMLGAAEVRRVASPVRAAPADIGAGMDKTIAALEQELARLKAMLGQPELRERISADDVDRLRSIHEELQVVLPG